MTRDEHRSLALHHLAHTSELGVPRAHPLRLAFIAEAQLHATLALSAPTAAPVLAINPPAVTPTTPHKRAAKKVAESKESDK